MKYRYILVNLFGEVRGTNSARSAWTWAKNNTRCALIVIDAQLGKILASNDKSQQTSISNKKWS